MVQESFESVGGGVLQPSVLWMIIAGIGVGIIALLLTFIGIFRIKRKGNG